MKFLRFLFFVSLKLFGFLHPLDPIFFGGVLKVHDEFLRQLNCVFLESLHVRPELVDLVVLTVHGGGQVPPHLKDAFLALFPLLGLLARLAPRAHLFLHHFESIKLHLGAYVLHLLLLLQFFSI